MGGCVGHLLPSIHHSLIPPFLLVHIISGLLLQDQYDRCIQVSLHIYLDRHHLVRVLHYITSQCLSSWVDLPAAQLTDPCLGICI